MIEDTAGGAAAEDAVLADPDGVPTRGLTESRSPRAEAPAEWPAAVAPLGPD